MPTYEYECLSCGITMEKHQRITEDQLTECPECHGALRRLIGAGAGFIFKGSGFHSTDYRSDSYKKGAKEDKKHVTSDSASPACAGCPKSDSCAKKE